MKINVRIYSVGLLIIATLTAATNYFWSPRKIGISEDFANDRLMEVLADTSVRPWNRGGEEIILIKSEDVAIAVAEPILFGIYGKETILRERPYGVHKFNHFWYVSGSLPRLYGSGGTFEIILDSRDARVRSIKHYK